MKFRSDTEIGECIRRLRQEADLSQTDLANAAGIDQSALSRIEKGERAVTAREVVLFARLLGTDPDHLLRQEEPEGDLLLLRSNGDSDEATRRCAEIFAECIEDFFGLEAMSR